MVPIPPRSRWRTPTAPCSSAGPAGAPPPRDPPFIANVRDIGGRHLNPPDRALVLAVDAKPQIAAHEPTAPVVSLRPGQVERHTHDYGTRLRPARDYRPPHPR